MPYLPKITAQRADYIRDSFINEYGFDPCGVYCSATGKQTGLTHTTEFAMLIDDIGVGDADEMIDDIAMRLLASMRPSIRWNKFRDHTLAEMRVKHPIETLAFLVNRLFQPLGHRKLGVESMLGFYSDRIKAYSLLESWGITDETNTILYMLLELDAKWNLDTEFPPFSAADFFFDSPTMAHRVEMLQAWYVRRMADWDKKQKAAEMQTRWMRSGNVLAKPAFMAAFLEAKPLSESAIKKEKKSEEKAFMAGLLSEIMMGRVETPEEAEAIKPKPTFVRITKAPTRFGVK